MSGRATEARLKTTNPARSTLRRSPMLFAPCARIGSDVSETRHLNEADAAWI
jgi:hypothetical protein